MEESLSSEKLQFPLKVRKHHGVETLPLHTQTGVTPLPVGWRAERERGLGWESLVPSSSILDVPGGTGLSLLPVPSTPSAPAYYPEAGPKGSAESSLQRKGGGGGEMALTDSRPFWEGADLSSPREGGIDVPQAGVCAAPFLPSLTRLLSWT